MTINEYEAFLKWHFESWKLHCADSDTVDEARKIYERIYQNDKPIHLAERERGFMAWQAAKAQAVPEWTSVNDSLPAYEELVLIKTNKGTVQGYLFQDEEYCEMKGEYLKYDGWQDDFHDDFIEYEDVTHWMPFPKALIKSGAEG
ncbi:hypothetical protein B7L44_05190 [Acinetobacter nosocomialis]|uniref:DUF551 domain-containing protein n=1 Tax=Acinetobacter nosocomialis TaxID=106654 RepID=UPI0009E0F673|nr:DUF551 domain-containing protein [Acinetobacter nosocomialis]ARG16036.1 hypothetical protein B7L44_05190 [Acinetobacter nosocomialis]